MRSFLVGMSRIVKKKLKVIDGVNVCNDGYFFVVSGKTEKISVNLNGLVAVSGDKDLSFQSLEDKDRGMLGSSYVLIKNAMNDVTNGFSAKLKMVGVGFKANVTGKFLRVYIGFSHDVFIAIPDALKVEVINDVDITVKGYNRSDVMQFARTVRDMKKPEPYKGKGIFLNDEKVVRKEGKKK